MKRTLYTLTSTRDRYAADIAALEADITKKRQEWHDENAKQYNGDDVCYHCGQPLPLKCVKEILPTSTRPRTTTKPRFRHKARRWHNALKH